MKKVFIVWIACLGLAGCETKELSRDKAFELLKEEMQYPKVIDYDIFCADPEHATKAVNAGLEDQGFVTVKKTQKIMDIGKPLIEFTEKASPYLLPVPEKEKSNSMQKVKIAEEDLIEITGIRSMEDGKTAVVEYKTAYKNVTPFAKFIRSDLKTEYNRSASFTLYDDGWRLERKR